MEDKILELCKRVEKSENNNWKCYHEFYCDECPFGSKKNNGKCCGKDTHENYIQIARNYINEHEKTVNTIEKIEEKHKYKVGDKVKIRYMDPDKYSEPMVDCGGDIATITNIINSQGNIQYRVKENYYYWDEEMLEPVEENVTLKELQEIKKDNIIPTYYHKGSYDVIEFCNKYEIGFVTGNIIKYLVRYKNKNGIEDLKKAKEYLNRRYIENLIIDNEDKIKFYRENNLSYEQGKIIDLVFDNCHKRAEEILNDLIKYEEKKESDINE